MRDAKQRAQDVSKRFEDVKSERCDRFNSCFEHVKGCIDGIYKVRIGFSSLHRCLLDFHFLCQNEDHVLAHLETTEVDSQFWLQIARRAVSYSDTPAMIQSNAS